MTNTREELGPFVAAECLQELRVHVEDLIGRSAVLGAGRMRGAGLVEFLGMTGSQPEPTEVKEAFGRALGADGTNLAIIDEVTEQDGIYTVTIHDGACSYNRSSEEPACAFTLGVFIGGFGALYGAAMSGQEVECEAMGAEHCVYKIKRHLAAA